VFWYGTVRAITKNSVQTVERFNLNRGRVRAFQQKSRKTVKKVRYASRSTKTVSRGKRWGTVRYGTDTDKFGLPSVISNQKVQFNQNLKVFFLLLTPMSPTHYRQYHLFTVFLSFLKRERFPLFVRWRYCVPTRTFIGVPDHSALQSFTVPDRLHEHSMNVCECSVSVFDRLISVCDLFMTRKAQKRS
jgi:hypothetical protein